MSWRYKSEVGTFDIRFEEGRYWLYLEDERLDSYPSPEDAASDVYTQTTGYFEWDDLDSPEMPAGLDDWEQVHGLDKPPRS